jgi:hypothetical protein
LKAHRRGFSGSTDYVHVVGAVKVSGGHFSQMDWLNSAGMNGQGWKTRFPIPSMDMDGLDVLDATGMSETWGFRLAQRVLEEVLISSIDAQPSSS